MVDQRGDSRPQQPQEEVVGAGDEAYQLCEFQGEELQYDLGIQISVSDSSDRGDDRMSEDAASAESTSY